MSISAGYNRKVPSESDPNAPLLASPAVLFAA